jgi:hypothetical protein
VIGRVSYEVVRVIPGEGGSRAWTLPHASARTLEEARAIAGRELAHWIVVERRVVDASCDKAPKESGPPGD